MLGDGFRLLPRVTAAAAAEFVGSLGDSATLQGGDPLASVTWLQRAAHVRDGASRLETALMYGEATAGGQPLRLRVAQLPRRAGDRWVGLPATAQQPIGSGRLSLVVQSATGAPPAAGAPVAGLVVDEWTEVVPDRTQVTGLSFHVDQPDARAPQAILLAVPPTEAHVWSLSALEATVLETLELARLRLVDGEALAAVPAGPPPPGPPPPRLGQYLPAIYLASAPAVGHRDHRPRAGGRPGLGLMAGEPTRWARLEPISRDPELAPGLEARVHDPLWLLGRQWQFGEFAASDGGSAILAQVTASVAPLNKLRAGRPVATPRFGNYSADGDAAGDAGRGRRHPRRAHGAHARPRGTALRAPARRAQPRPVRGRVRTAYPIAATPDPGMRPAGASWPWWRGAPSTARSSTATSRRRCARRRRRCPPRRPSPRPTPPP